MRHFLNFVLVALSIAQFIIEHQVGISVPGATLGDRSTSCLGRHLCQSDNDDDDNDDDNDTKLVLPMMK